MATSLVTASSLAVSDVFAFRRSLLYTVITLSAVLSTWICEAQQDSPIRIAVASNFYPTAQKLITAYQSHQESSSNIQLIAASTGKLHSQILHGAPYHLYLAADQSSPQALEQAGVGIIGTRATYALGRLVLLLSKDSPTESHSQVTTSQELTRLLRAAYKHKYKHKNLIALANPKLAPYGAATQSLLERLELWKEIQPQLIFAENVSQAWHYHHSGHVSLAFTAHSLLPRSSQSVPPPHLLIPAELHAPIIQQALLLREHPTARSFLDYLLSSESHPILKEAGYTIPSPSQAR